jgi:hypothetical protein
MDEIAVDLFEPLDKSSSPQLPDRSVRPSIELHAPVLYAQANMPLEKVFETDEEITPSWMEKFRKELRDPFLGRKQAPAAATATTATKADATTFAKNSADRLQKIYAACHRLYPAGKGQAFDDALEALKEGCREIFEHERAATLVASTKED